jgi:addiction module HigA family antidote
VKTATESRVDVRRMKRAPAHPGEILIEEFLKLLGMSQAEAARSIKISLNRLNELVRGKRGVTAETALRLALLLGDIAGDSAEPADDLRLVARVAARAAPWRRMSEIDRSACLTCRAISASCASDPAPRRAS